MTKILEFLKEAWLPSNLKKELLLPPPPFSFADRLVLLNSILLSTYKKCVLHLCNFFLVDLSSRFASKYLRRCMLYLLYIYIIPIQTPQEAIKRRAVLWQHCSPALQSCYFFAWYRNSCRLAVCTVLTLFSEWKIGQICMQQYFKHILPLMHGSHFLYCF